MRRRMRVTAIHLRHGKTHDKYVRTRQEADWRLPQILCDFKGVPARSIVQIRRTLNRLLLHMDFARES